MKKLIMIFFVFISFLTLQARAENCVMNTPKECSWCNELFEDSRFTIAFSSGYVFKHDDRNFRSVYGYGMGDIITADFCYRLCESCWGIGAKASYWLALGKTTFFRRHTFLQEVPVIAYVRAWKNFERGLRLYGSLGGGFAYINEKSYLGRVQQVRGLGEVEAGFFYPVWYCLTLTGAFRYLFPRQKQSSVKIDPGGFDLRAGLAIYF